MFSVHYDKVTLSKQQIGNMGYVFIEHHPVNNGTFTLCFCESCELYVKWRIRVMTMQDIAGAKTQTLLMLMGD